METTIHDVKSLVISKIRKNIGKTRVRSIFVETDEGLKLELTLFGKKENLGIEVEKTVEIEKTVKI